jgi:hypothetical protein
MRLRSILLGALASTAVLGAELPKYSFVAYFYTGLKNVDLEALQLNDRDLGFESTEPILGFDIELNGDGISDSVLRGPCGNSTCALRLIDGKTKRLVASVVGRPLIVHSAKINGWSVLSTYHHLGATGGIYTTYVYDGQRYQQVSSIALYEESVSALFKELESVETIGRPGNVQSAPNKSLQRAAPP